MVSSCQLSSGINNSFSLWENQVREKYLPARFFISLGEGDSTEEAKKSAYQSLVLSLKNNTTLNQQYREVLKGEEFSSRLETTMGQKTKITLKNISYSTSFIKKKKSYIYVAIDREEMAKFYGSQIDKETYLLNKLSRSEKVPQADDCLLYVNYLDNISYYEIFNKAGNNIDHLLIQKVNDRIKKLKNNYSLQFENTSLYIEKSIKEKWGGSLSPQNKRFLIEIRYELDEIERISGSFTQTGKAIIFIKSQYLDLVQTTDTFRVSRSLEYKVGSQLKAKLKVEILKEVRKIFNEELFCFSK